MLLVERNLLYLIQILDYRISLLAQIVLLYRRLLQLMGNMVDMPLQCQNLLHIIFLFLSQLGQMLCSSAHFGLG